MRQDAKWVFQRRAQAAQHLFKVSTWLKLERKVVAMLIISWFCQGRDGRAISDRCQQRIGL
jgi:hypothetical protein